MEEHKKSYLEFESSQARMERINRRSWILCIILIVALLVTNGAWLYYESQFMDTVTVTQDTPNGNNNYVGHNGNITNGTTDGN